MPQTSPPELLFPFRSVSTSLNHTANFELMNWKAAVGGSPNKEGRAYDYATGDRGHGIAVSISITDIHDGTALDGEVEGIRVVSVVVG